MKIERIKIELLKTIGILYLGLVLFIGIYIHSILPTYWKLTASCGFVFFFDVIGFVPIIEKSEDMERRLTQIINP